MIKLSQWITIADYPAYEINDKGQIHNKLTDKILLGTKNANGYRYHRLHQYDQNNKSIGFKDFLTHILVANYFVLNPDKKPLVNHLDENKMNSNALNLKWATEKENSNHGSRNQKISKGGRPVCEYDLDGHLIRIWKSAVAVSSVYDIAARSIHDPCKNKKGTSYGRQWRYYDDTFGADINKAKCGTKMKTYNYNYFIPEDLLLNSTMSIESCINDLNDIINNIPMPNYYLNNINDIIEFINNLNYPV